MLNRLGEIAERHSEVERLLSLPETAQDSNAMRRLGREYSDLQNVVNLWKEYELINDALEQAQSIVSDETDPELLDMARAEILELEEKLAPLVESIQTALIPKDATEHADAVIEIRAGAGGDEAGLFAGDLLRMYQRYAEANSWKLDVLDSSETGVGGVKDPRGNRVFLRVALTLIQDQRNIICRSRQHLLRIPPVKAVVAEGCKPDRGFADAAARCA